MSNWALALQPFGAELEPDLGSELGPGHQQCLGHLHRRHDLMAVRGRILSMDDQIGALGAPRLPGPVLGPAEISHPSAFGLGGAEPCYHSDDVEGPERPLGISPHVQDLGDGQTSTRLASDRVGCKALAPLARSAVGSRRPSGSNRAYPRSRPVCRPGSGRTLHRRCALTEIRRVPPRPDPS